MRYYNLPNHRGSGHHSPLNMAVRGLVASDWIAYIKDSAVWKPDHLSSLVGLVVLSGGGVGGSHNSPAVRGLVASDWIAYIKDSAVWKPDHLSSLVRVSAWFGGRRLDRGRTRGAVGVPEAGGGRGATTALSTWLSDGSLHLTGSLTSKTVQCGSLTTFQAWWVWLCSRRGGWARAGGW